MGKTLLHEYQFDFLLKMDVWIVIFHQNSKYQGLPPSSLPFLWSQTLRKQLFYFISVFGHLCFNLLLIVQSLSRVHLFATPWPTACQAPLSFTVSWSLLKLMYIESVMPSNHLILCHPLLLLPSVFPSIRQLFAPGGQNHRQFYDW